MGCCNLKDTFWVLVQDSLYNQGYFSKHTILVFFTGLSFITLVAIWKGLMVFKEKDNSILATLYSLVSILFLGIVIVMVLQKVILGTQYFINRKSLMFIPLFGLLLFCFFLSKTYKKPILQNFLAGIIIFASVYHFSRSMNVTSNREWWYDHYTLEMLGYLEEKLGPNEEIELGVHWMFHPTSMYYKKTKGLTFFKDLHYDKNILPNAGYDYYYVFCSNHERFLLEGYEIEKKYEFACLVKRIK